MIVDGNSSDMEQLGEDDEEEEKERTPKAMHDNGSPDSSDEEDYQDESVAHASMEVEVPKTTNFCT